MGEPRNEPEWLATLRHNLRTQDNRITSHPVFVVQQKRRIYGIDTDYSDNVVWIYEGEEVGADLARSLERQHNQGEDTPGEYTRTAYQDIWEFVTACFTEQGCQDYLAANGHNLHEPRIFVESGYRNEEWQRLRAHLSGEPAPSPPGPVGVPAPRIEAWAVVRRCELAEAACLVLDRELTDAMRLYAGGHDRLPPWVREAVTAIRAREPIPVPAEQAEPDPADVYRCTHCNEPVDPESGMCGCGMLQLVLAEQAAGVPVHIEQHDEQWRREFATEYSNRAHGGRVGAEMRPKSVEALREALQDAHAALDRDRTGLAEALDNVRKEIRGRVWITEGRGSYEWDDKRYRDEAHEAFDAVLVIVESALHASGRIADAGCRAARAALASVPAEQPSAPPWLAQCLAAWREVPAESRDEVMRDVVAIADELQHWDGSPTAPQALRIAAALLRAAEKG